jgi:hypothetical protein
MSAVETHMDLDRITPACAMSPTSNSAGAFAIRVAYESTTGQRAPLPVDAGRSDRIRNARPHGGRRGHRSQPCGRTDQAGDRLVASPRRAGQLPQRGGIGEQSTRSGVPGRVCSGAVTGSHVHDRNTTATTGIARRSNR